MRLAGLAPLFITTLVIPSACSKPKEAPPNAVASALPSKASAPSASSAPSGRATHVASSATAVPPLPLPSGVSPSASYLVSLDTDGCPVELRINDVPLRDLEAGRPRAFGEVVDPWLTSGVNTLSLVARETVSKGCASLKVLAVPEGGDQRTAPRVLEATWPATERATGEQPFEFHGPAAERCQLWRDAAAVELDASARSELLAEVRSLHRLFEKRQVASLAERLDYRAKDIARCLQKAPALGVEDQKRFLAHVASVPPFAPLPADDTELALDVVGQGKLVWVHRRGPKLLFENGAGGGLDLYFAKIGGRFTVVR